MSDAARPRSGTSGAERLASRVETLPILLRRAFEELPAEVAHAGLGRDVVRGVVATGTGSSGAHARFLASLLSERGVAARAVPLGSFLDGPPPAAPDEAVIVFSQGLSPNARVALRRRDDGARTWLVTATEDPDPTPSKAGSASAPRGHPGADGTSPAGEASATTTSSSQDRREVLRDLRARGVAVVRTPGADEFGTLVRVVGPMVGFAAALAIADALAPPCAAHGGTPSIEPRLVEAACGSVAGASSRWREIAATLHPAELAAPIVFVASGAHLHRIANLPLKLLEGLLRPLPPSFDLLDFAHGPLQQLYDGPALVVAC
ncbi:MAG: hypothetical protein ACKO2K_00700, partial [Alphaproteobacteria bacterium]